MQICGPSAPCLPSCNAAARQRETDQGKGQKRAQREHTLTLVRIHPRKIETKGEYADRGGLESGTGSAPFAHGIPLAWKTAARSVQVHTLSPPPQSNGGLHATVVQYMHACRRSDSPKRDRSAEAACSRARVHPTSFLSSSSVHVCVYVHMAAQQGSRSVDGPAQAQRTSICRRDILGEATALRQCGK